MEVHQWLGLYNFFRAYVRNFTQIAAPLTELTPKDCPWKARDLPAKALQAFRELQRALTAELIPEEIGSTP